MHIMVLISFTFYQYTGWMGKKQGGNAEKAKTLIDRIGTREYGGNLTATAKMIQRGLCKIGKSREGT